jgi:hypothetical protein
MSRDRPRAAERNRKLRRFKQIWRPETRQRFSLRRRRLGHKKWEACSLASRRLSGNMCGGSWSYTHPRTCLWPSDVISVCFYGVMDFRNRWDVIYILISLLSEGPGSHICFLLSTFRH